MKHLMLILFLITTSIIYPQLKSLEVKPTENKGAIPVFTEFPDKAGIYFYTKFDNATFHSNYGIYKTYDRGPGNYVIIIEPSRQSIEVRIPGYKTEIIKIQDMHPRDVLFYTVEPKKEEEGIGGVKELAVTVVATPTDAEISLDGKPFRNDSPTIISIGEHELKVSKSGYGTKEEKIVVSPSQTLFKVMLKETELQTITVKSNPNEAEIIIDGASVGKTNKGIFRYPGNYRLSIRKEGYLQVDTNITVIEGTPLEVSKKLIKNVGYLNVSLTPTNATLYINKEIQTSRGRIELVPGKYLIEVEKEGYTTDKQQVDVEIGKESELKIELVAKVGKLQMSISPNEGKVKLYRGEEEIEEWVGIKIIPKIQVGKYKIIAKSEGYKSKEIGITIEENKTTQLDVELEKGSDVTGGFIYVEGGTFQMGGDHEYDGKPIHNVTVSSFYISKYEVTVKDYRAFCTATGKSMPKEPSWGWNDNDPIENVSWNNAVAYCSWAGVRLPTEAEWEYAAKGGNKSRGYKYSGSNTIGDVAWCYRNSNEKVHSVGTKLPNELGIYDMSGNVWEWCSDWYDEKYYETSPRSNPTGPKSGLSRVLRGCSYLSYDSSECLIAYRYRSSPGDSNVNFGVGFRVAKTK